jgi:hypothetical protein
MALAACGDGDGGAPDASNRVLLTGWTFDFSTVEPIVGVEVCVHADDAIPCALSDENGRYEIEADRNTRVVLRYSVVDYVTKLRHVNVGDVDEGLSIFNMQSETWLASQLAAVGVTWDRSMGILGVQISGEVDGATIALVPAAGDGPFYAGPGENFDPSLQAATSDGLGAVAIANVPPGDYSIVATQSDATCSTQQAPGTEPQSALGQSVADMISETFITCE